MIDQLMIILAGLLVYAVPVTLIYIWYRGENGKIQSLYTFSAVVIALIASYTVLGQAYYHERPYMLYDTLVSGPSENSFPSQHTTTMMGMVLPLLWFGKKKLAYFFIGGGLLTGFARIYIGKHYPLDIIGGMLSAVIGFAVMLLMMKYLDNYFRELADFGDKLENKLFQPFRTNMKKFR